MILKMILLCAILLFTVMTTGCLGLPIQAEIDASLNQFTLPESDTLTARFSDARLPDMIGIAESDRLKLFININSGEIAVIDKAIDSIWRSNPDKRHEDSIAVGVNKDLLSAQAVINFYNIYGHLSSVNTYTDSTAHNQMAFETIPDGIRVTYLFGTIQRTIENLPQMISIERFEELVLSKVDSTEERALTIAYRLDEEEGVYLRNDGLAGLQLKRALEAFEAAGYTDDDLAYDILAHNLTQTLPIPRFFMLSIEYTLHEDSLTVRVPMSSIQHLDEFPVSHIAVLNFFGAGGTDEQGVMFVPDGSGALIHFNNGKSNYPPYQQNIYGDDLTVEDTDLIRRDEKARMPVFGVIREDSAFLGIIEQGASVAAINADVSGRTNSYNSVYPHFYVLKMEETMLAAGGRTGSLFEFQERRMNTDFIIRYSFLYEDDASYAGMAKYYQKYLVDKNLLSDNRKNQEDDAPFYLQLIGGITKREHFLGVPYQALVPLTTLEEAKSIVSQLSNRNIHNINIKYSGWFNKGYNHRVPKSISVDNAIGGNAELEDFLAFAKDNRISFFPEIALLSFKNTSGLRESREVARRITDDLVSVYPIDMATNRPYTERYPHYLLSPRYIIQNTKAMLEDLVNFHVDNISLRDLADQLHSDHRRNMLIDRPEAETVSLRALEEIRQRGLDIIADGGNAYAWPYLSSITNVPLSNSNFKIQDESIPFLQMTIRGFIEYTGFPFNLSAFLNYRQYILRSLEYGSYIFFTWIYESNTIVMGTEYDYLFSVNYLHWIDLAERMYHEINDVLKHVRDQRIIDHKKLSDGVYKTVYENGVYIIVNYNRSSFTVDDIVVEEQNYIVGGVQP